MSKLPSKPPYSFMAALDTTAEATVLWHAVSSIDALPLWTSSDGRQNAGCGDPFPAAYWHT